MFTDFQGHQKGHKSFVLLGFTAFFGLTWTVKKVYNGGGNDDLPQNSLKARAPRNSLSYKRRSHLAQPLPDNPTRETIFSPDFPAPDEGDGFAVKPDTWRFSATTLNPAFGRRFGSQNGNRIDPGISPSADMGRSRGCPCSGSSRPCHGCRTRCLGSG